MSDYPAAAVVLLKVLGCRLTYFWGQAETSAEAWFNIALRPWKPEGLLGRTAQDGHLDSHTAPRKINPFQVDGEFFDCLKKEKKKKSS